MSQLEELRAEHAAELRKRDEDIDALVRDVETIGAELKTTIRMADASAAERDGLRGMLRVAEAVRDDARAHSQRLLDEKRALVDGMFSESDLEVLEWLRDRMGKDPNPDRRMTPLALSLLRWLLS